MRPIYMLCALIFVTSLSFSQARLPNKGSLSGPTGTPKIGFLIPDTVCLNAPVSVTNTSVGATTYYWNFCVANSSTNAKGTNLGNFGFNMPVFTDYARDSVNYYAFVTNNYPGKLVRLDFGNSLLNTPTAHDFGNLGGVIPDYCEGIQLVKNEGRWYAIILGGKPVGRIVKVDFGSALSNNAPVATNWGNIGDLAFPTDLHLFQKDKDWYGFTINAMTSTVTRFHFSSSFSNPPTAVNLGNIGNLNYPTGIYAITANNEWYAFVSNAGSGEGNSTNSSISRLDFGSSLLNKPTGVNLGNPGSTLKSARDLTIYQSCNEVFGFVVNYSTTNDIVRLNFNNVLTSVPTASSFGNVGNLDFPHCISKLFRVENDLYSFVTNVNNNTITRLKFDGCDNSSITGSTKHTPDPVRYTKPGTYNMNLIIDDGLPTQSSYCRQVVVVSNLHTPLQRKRICKGDSVLLSSSTENGNRWNTGSTTSAIFAKSAGTYWVQSHNAAGCTNIDSFEVSLNPVPVVGIGGDTSICEKDSLVLNAGNLGANYLWQNGQATPAFVAKKTGLYTLTVTKDGCFAKDSMMLRILLSPDVHISGKRTICKDATTTLMASGGVAYTWTSANGLSNTSGANIVVSPSITTTYQVLAKGENACTSKAMITITVIPKPSFKATTSTTVLCVGDTTMLMASGGDVYTWTPSVSLDAPNNNTTRAFPKNPTRYKVIIENNECQLKDSVFIDLPVATKPAVLTTKSNDINCIMGEARLYTGGGSQYLWTPETGLSDPTSSNPVVRISATTTYHLLVTSNNGCLVEDSITVNVTKGNTGTGFPVPNAFTPNNDGKNDCFNVKHWGDVSDLTMIIYNRWGKLLFVSDRLDQCWDGTFKGKLQPNDVYIYLIKGETFCGNVFRKGTFTLIR